VRRARKAEQQREEERDPALIALEEHTDIGLEADKVLLCRD